jgi:hypothetical protein
MTQHYTIAVGPVEGGWSVVCDAAQEPMVFLSGARAEAQARALAQRLSLDGDEVELTVRDRAKMLVGSSRYYAGMLALGERARSFTR